MLLHYAFGSSPAEVSSATAFARERSSKGESLDGDCPRSTAANRPESLDHQG